ncbi:SulP family inorganic anion transporter [Halochromatium salexigens]|uniref:Sodium-independent anion transporter n=1 Tax=Halochromatium salexigens TaxID=49447 RepID=A0AAJ0UG32_HALSE|nr:SulP family inorganic anion transporter [Halochromatium salexigens]MBK5930814.1 sodium-independent anion transporter [Halochromatium salexigens]
MRIFNQINLGNLKGDLFGGVTAAVIALPMALAFGVASGAGAEAGLYGAVLIGLFAALFGGTPTLISEPTGPMTVVFTAVIATMTAANPEHGMAMAFTTVMLTGLFQLTFGLLKLGRYVTMMPYTVISGFMSGIGFILIIIQLPPLLGHDPPTGGVLGALTALPSLIAEVNPAEATLGLLSLAILVLMPKRFGRIIPPQLLVLIAGTLAAIYLLPTLFEGAPYRAIGAVPGGLPSLQIPTFSTGQLQTIVINALVLALLGSIDALLTSVIADSLTRSVHNSDKELMGQGLGNMASGLFGGLPGAGATMGTVVNIQTGARTALSGLTRALILAVVVFGASALVEPIPKAVLAGIAIKVGLDIVDWSFLRRAHRVSIRGALIMYGVIAMTVFVDLITAVGIGLFVANVLTIRRLADLQSEGVRVLGLPHTEDGLSCPHANPEEERILRNPSNGVVMLCLSGPLIFGAAKAVTRQQHELVETRSLVVDMTDVPHLGVTTSLAVEEVLRAALAHGCRVYLSGLHEQPRKRLKNLGLAKVIPLENWIDARSDALKRAISERAGQRRDPPPGGQSG